jgi:trimeric autotransporter adhesin
MPNAFAFLLVAAAVFGGSGSVSGAGPSGQQPDRSVSIIRTVAGGGATEDGMPATMAVLGLTPAVAVDAGGNIYIAAPVTKRVFRIDDSLTLTIVAGTGVSGGAIGDGGAATAAQLTYPSGVAVDWAGNVFISDFSDNRVRVVAAGTGVITTIAGTGAAGFGGDGGVATAARLSSPAGLAVDGDGNLFIADAGNNRIRKVEAGTGVITTAAGGGAVIGDGGPATAAQLNSPYGLAVDSAGNLYIADTNNHRIRRVAAGTGVITSVAGSGVAGFEGDGGSATAAWIYGPRGVALDGIGDLLVADSGNHRIRKVAASTGVIETVVGSGTPGFGGDNGPATAAQLCWPSGLAIDAAGNLYIADQTNRRVRKVSAATGEVTTIAGTGTEPDWGAFGGDGGAATWAQLYRPSSVAKDAAGNLYIADAQNGRVRRVDAETGIISTAAGGGALIGDGGAATAVQLRYPSGVEVDAAGNLFIADELDQRIRRVTAETGVITTVAGTGYAGFSGDGGPATAAALIFPSGLAVDAAGNLFIADQGNHRVRMVAAATGVITTVAGTGTAGFGGDGGAATAAQLYYPSDVAVDTLGNLIVADDSNHRVRMVAAATGVITTVAGTGTAGFSGDAGMAAEAQLNYPTGVALDAVGRVFIADSYNSRVRMVDPSTGVITTVAGTGVSGFAGDGGPATEAWVSYPVGVHVDGAGNLLIVDGGNHRIRVVESGIAAPGVTAIVTGTPGANGWYVGDVAVNWAVTDPDGSVSVRTGCDPAAVTGDTNGITFTCTAAGPGGTTSQAVTIKRDASAPSVTVVTPAQGAGYAVGSSVMANFSCEDTGPSGVHSCAGTVPNGAALPTATAGPATFVGTAEDAAGNQAAVTVSYSIGRLTPALSWPAPAPIVHGIPLSGIQLNATADVPGTFTYTPPIGTVLSLGAAQALSVVFEPADALNYAGAAMRVAIDVVDALPMVDSWHAPNAGPISVTNAAPALVLLNFSGDIDTGGSGTDLVATYRVDGNPVGPTFHTYLRGSESPQHRESLNFPALVEIGAGEHVIALSLVQTGDTDPLLNQNLSVVRINTVAGVPAADGWQASSAGPVTVTNAAPALVLLNFSGDIDTGGSGTDLVATYRVDGNPVGPTFHTYLRGSESPQHRESLSFPALVEIGAGEHVITLSLVQTGDTDPLLNQSLNVVRFNTVAGVPAAEGWQVSGAGPITVTNSEPAPIQLLFSGDIDTGGSGTDLVATYMVDGNPAGPTFHTYLRGSQSPQHRESLSFPALVEIGAGEHVVTLSLVQTGDTDPLLNRNLSVIRFNTIRSKATPELTWPRPADIVYGTPLGPDQLNATSNVPGTFTYTPPAGSALLPGTHTLTVAFTPDDGATYGAAAASVTIRILPAAGTNAVPFDFDGDRRSDIVWHHATLGEVWLWRMGGAERLSESFVRTVPDTSFEIRGFGDQNGDRNADLLWRSRTTGDVYFWSMNGSMPEAETYVANVDQSYDIVGTGDFDGDGKSDILWRHATLGEVWIWLMDGATPRSQIYVDRVDPGYAVKGVGDLDADGKADIVWHHGAIGEVWVWPMNGATRLDQVWVNTVPDTGYQIRGVADFTGDGKGDLLWWHATRGEVWIWAMDGPARISEAWVATVPDTDYRIVGTGDYDGDGKADILWHHTARGEVWVWLMDGVTRRSETWVSSVPDVGYRVATTGAARSGPAVSVTASIPAAAEGGTAGVFTVSRTGDVSAALTGVSYTVAGTAVPGVDFAPLMAASGSLDFAAGQAAVTVTISPLNDALAEGTETVVMTLVDGLSYDIGAAAAATVTIADVSSPLVGTWSGGTGQEPSQLFRMYVDREGIAGLFTYAISGGCIAEVVLDPVAPAPIANGSFTINFSTGSATGTVAGALAGDGTAAGTITASFSMISGCTPVSTTWSAAHVDAGPIPIVSIAVSDPDAAEVGPDPGAFTITRVGSTAQELAVQYGISGTAANGTDYASLSGGVTIPVGESLVTIAVNPLLDTLVDASESVVLTVNDWPEYKLGAARQASLAIVDPPAPIITIAAADAEAYEYGLDPGTITVSRVGILTLPLNVFFRFGGTASHSQDYEAFYSPVTIPAGQASVTLTVTPRQDYQVESPETATLTLTDGDHYDLGASAVATVTIADSATTVAVDATDPDASEVGLSPGTFTFTRTGPAAAALTVQFAVGGTATVTADYEGLGGSIVIPAGQAAATKAVTPRADALVEPAETVTVTLLTDISYNVGTPASATVTIADQPVPVVTIIATDPTATEAGLTTGTFTISRTGDTTTALTVSYSIGGTATHGSDYSYVFSPVTIPAGQASATVTVTPLQDWQAESPETVVLMLMDGANYDLGPAGTQTATVTITSDE